MGRGISRLSTGATGLALVTTPTGSAHRPIPAAFAPAPKSTPAEDFQRSSLRRQAIANGVPRVGRAAAQISAASRPIAAGAASLPKDTRVAIIGGGATGLSFADRLRERGYSAVTVFEASEAVGGKTSTEYIDGKPYEMGAVVGWPGDYDPVFKLAREGGVELHRVKKTRAFDLETGREEAGPGFWGNLKLVQETVQYMLAHRFQWKGITPGGLHEVSPELYAPWQSVVDQRNLHRFERTMRPFINGCGYSTGQMPAAFIARYIPPEMVLSVARNGVSAYGGTQSIWTHTAERLAQAGVEIRTGAPVRTIDRRGDKVEISAGDGGPESFDKVVLAADLRHLLGVLDATPEEKALFSKVQKVDYRNFLCRVSGLPDEHESRVQGIILDNMLPGNEGRPMLWVKPHADNLYVIYAFGDEQLDDDAVFEKIRADLERLGATVEAPLVARKWDYAPHVDSAAMAEGFHDKLEALQGLKNTYSAGEVHSFGTLAWVTRNAQDIAERMVKNDFPALRQK